jgi:RNA polymerase sigma factor (TIGR02999 family)
MSAGFVPQDGRLPELVYEQLKAIAHTRMLGERRGHMLHTTALVHEALLKLTQDGQINLDDRPGFFRAAAASMRQILIDHARANARLKRGGGDAQRVDLDLAAVGETTTFEPDQLLAIDDAMERLAAHDPNGAEVVRLRFYGGLTMDEIAETTDTPLRTVERRWTYARAWLWRELRSDNA